MNQNVMETLDESCSDVANDSDMKFWHNCMKMMPLFRFFRVHLTAFNCKVCGVCVSGWVGWGWGCWASMVLLLLVVVNCGSH